MNITWKMFDRVIGNKRIVLSKQTFVENLIVHTTRPVFIEIVNVVFILRYKKKNEYNNTVK